MSLLPDKVHSSWEEFLDTNIREMLREIECSIGETLNPPKDRALRFLETNLDTLKVVILGQDPYPEQGVATGRAFEVGNLKSWDQTFRQVSLKNMIRLIYKSVKGIKGYSEIPSFSEVLKEIRKGNFKIADPPDLFNSLTDQGVLFLNTCFTVYPGKPLSHRAFWEPFTRKLIPYISEKNTNISWFLWGRSALSFKPLIRNGTFYESRHPMMCSEKYSDDFLKSDCIIKTMDQVNWTGIRQNQF